MNSLQYLKLRLLSIAGLTMFSCHSLQANPITHVKAYPFNTSNATTSSQYPTSKPIKFEDYFVKSTTPRSLHLTTGNPNQLVITAPNASVSGIKYLRYTLYSDLCGTPVGTSTIGPFAAPMTIAQGSSYHTTDAANFNWQQLSPTNVTLGYCMFLRTTNEGTDCATSGAGGIYYPVTVTLLDENQAPIVTSPCSTSSPSGFALIIPGTNQNTCTGSTFCGFANANLTWAIN